MPLTYTIERIPTGRLSGQDWNDPLWADVTPVQIDQIHAKSSDHHPKVTARVLHDQRSIFIKYEVQDRYVLAKAEKFQDSVCVDSCVEFFFLPKQSKGYFNFEFNCGGTMLVHYVEDWSRTEKGLKKFKELDWSAASAVAIGHSMPKIVSPEIAEPTNWWLGARIPMSTLEAYISPVGDLGGQTWTANFYKCADRSSHPHWLSWSPIGEPCRFHQPDKFGTIMFGKEVTKK